MDYGEIVRKLNYCFPKGRVLDDREPIEYLVEPKSNTYFILGNCENKMDVDCKILEWLSRAAYKTEPFYGIKKNQEFHKYILNGINMYFDTVFSEEDMEEIYTHLGNACHHSNTINFIESDFDFGVFSEKER